MKKHIFIALGLFFLIGYTHITMAFGQETKIPQGAINGLFSISKTKQVYFSKGNLQYIGSAKKPHWKFADHQWDVLGNAQNEDSQNIDRDLFAFGTSGFNHGAICYQPWSYDYSPENYFAYGGVYNHLYNQDGTADWGANPISNGGNVGKQWRTLSMDDFHYLVSRRVTESGILFAMAQVNGVNGMIILPDDWSRMTYILQNKNDKDASFSSNIISLEDWTAMEKKGAVFLPAGSYWTSNACDNKKSFQIVINDKCMLYAGIYLDRCAHAKVRLIQIAN